MTPRNTKRQRLETAGWVHVSGWLPQRKGSLHHGAIDVSPADVMSAIRYHAAEAERIAETRKPSGRPRKADKP